MGALALLILPAGPAEAAAPQAHLDTLVHRCAAEKVVRLTARSRHEVIIAMAHSERAPTASENRRFACVLAGMRRMKGLRFGFLGNAPPDR